MFDFTNFHDETIATFTPCDVPVRTPDYESDSGSRYWDTGDGVIRQSDHWVGQHGVRSIRSCKWMLDTQHPFGYLATGYCAYADMAVRKRAPVWHIVTKKDREAAEALNGVAIPASEWVTGSGRRVRKMPVPPWAYETGVWSTDHKVRRLLKQRPRVKYAIAADQRVIRSILAGAKRVKVGECYKD